MKTLNEIAEQEVRDRLSAKAHCQEFLDNRNRSIAYEAAKYGWDTCIRESPTVKKLVGALNNYAEGKIDNQECEHGFRIDKCPNDCDDRSAYQALELYHKLTRGSE